MVFFGALDTMACVCSSYTLTEEELDRFEFIAFVKTDSIYASDKEKQSEHDLFFEVSFKIKKLYKGNHQTSIMVNGAHHSVNDSWTSCDMGIEPGEEWILLGYLDKKGQLRTGYCSFNIRYKTREGELNWKSKAFEETTTFLNEQFGFERESEKFLDGRLVTHYPNGNIERE